MEYVCNFLNHNSSYVGPSVEALERLAAYPEYHGFDLLEDGERRYRFNRTLWADEP